MPANAAIPSAKNWLVCRLHSRLCASPIEQVLEVMRPLPIEPLAQSSAIVLGLCIYRGAPIAVVDAAMIVGDRQDQSSRFVAIDVGGRVVAMTFGDVVGVRAIGAETGVELPPLLQDAGGDRVSAKSVLDS